MTRPEWVASIDPSTILHMSQTNTVLAPKFLDSFKSGGMGPLMSNIPDDTPYTYRHTTSMGTTLPGIRAIAEAPATAEWAEHCDISTNVVFMRPPFTYKGKNEQVMTRILEATDPDSLKKTMEDLVEHQLWAGGEPPLSHSVDDKSQDQSMEIDLFLNEAGDPCGLELTVYDNEGYYRYGRRGEYLLVEGTIYKNRLGKDTCSAQDTRYRLSATARSTELWGMVPGRELLGNTSKLLAPRPPVQTESQ